jgi:uncharacterized protein (DUF58 family)
MIREFRPDGPRARLVVDATASMTFRARARFRIPLRGAAAARAQVALSSGDPVGAVIIVVGSRSRARRRT